MSDNLTFEEIVEYLNEKAVNRVDAPVAKVIINGSNNNIRIVGSRSVRVAPATLETPPEYDDQEYYEEFPYRPDVDVTDQVSNYLPIYEDDETGGICDEVEVFLPKDAFAALCMEINNDPEW